MILLSVYCLAEEVSGATAQTGGSETISLVGFPPWLVWPLAILGGLAILAYLIKQIRGWVPPGGLLDCRPPRGETRPDARQSADMQEIQSRLNAVNSRVDDLDKKVNETSVKVVVSELKQYMKEGLASLIAQQVVANMGKRQQSTNAPQSAQTPAPTSLSGADVHAPAGPRLPASTAQGLGDSTKLGLGDGAETKKADKATECEENIRLCKQELQRFADGLWKTRKKDWQAKIKPLEDKRQEINECAEAMLKVIQTFGDSICKYEKDYHPVAVAMGVLQGGRDAKDQKGGIKGRWELLQKDLAQLVSPTEPSLPEPPPHVVSLGEEEGKRVLREWQSSAEEQFKKKAADALPDAETANLLDTYKYLRYDCAYEMIAQIEGLKGIKAAGAPGQGLSAWCNADANGLIQRIEEVSELEPISPGPGDNLDLKLHDRSSGTGDRIKECIKKGYRKPGGESSGVFRKAEVVTHN